VDQGQFSDPDFFLSAAHIQGKMSNLPIKILIQYTLPQAKLRKKLEKNSLFLFKITVM
jgi:hypothetical protein